MHCQVYGGAFWIYSEVLDRRWVQSLCLVLNMCEEILYICFQYILNICSWQKQERNVSHMFLQLCGVCRKNPRSFQWFAQHEADHQQSVMEFRNDDLAITPFKFYMETEPDCLERYVLSNIAIWGTVSMPNFRGVQWWKGGRFKFNLWQLPEITWCHHVRDLV